MKPGGRTTLSPAQRAALTNLRVDVVTAEVIIGLRKARIQPILLKGPSIVAWLYGDGASRPYGDTDILVAPDAIGAASNALRAHGFRRQPSAIASFTWTRGADSSVVDLHDSLFGAACAAQEQWRVLSEHSEPMLVGGLNLEVLSPPARLLHIVLHAAQHRADGFDQPVADLRRALELADDRCWQDAARLAERLEATRAFASGLELDARGSRWIRSDYLTAQAPAVVSLHARGSSPFVVTLELLANSRGLRRRLRFLGERVAPPAQYMRWRYPRLAGRGRAALVVAYLWRPVSIVPRLPAALLSWRRARRSLGPS